MTKLYSKPETGMVLIKAEASFLVSSGEQAAEIAPIKATVDNFTSEDTWESSFDINME